MTGFWPLGCGWEGGRPDLVLNDILGDLSLTSSALAILMSACSKWLSCRADENDSTYTGFSMGKYKFILLNHCDFKAIC